MNVVPFFALQASRVISAVDTVLQTDVTDLIFFIETILTFITSAVIHASTAMRRTIQANLAYLIEEIFIHAYCACCLVATTIASCQSSIAGRTGGATLMICVGLTLTAYDIVVILQTCKAIFYGFFAFHTHIFGPPVVLLAETGVVYWFSLEITINIAE